MVKHTLRKIWNEIWWRNICAVMEKCNSVRLTGAFLFYLMLHLHFSIYASDTQFPNLLGTEIINI